MKFTKSCLHAAFTGMVTGNISTMNPRFIVLWASFILFLLPLVQAQQTGKFIEGMVGERSEQGEPIPLIGANVYWLNTLAGTTTDPDGKFKLKRFPGETHLVISFVGYQPDTIDVSGQDQVSVKLSSSIAIDELLVVHREKSTKIGYLEPLKVEKIGQKELVKAACCNLSESFETNPSVDVSFTDAVTGTRQIEMLGLAGPYTQITREVIPDVRGLSAINGLTYTPGTWIEGIQLIKGTGSVSNGFESIAGQINVELWKPETMDKLYLNGYANGKGRVEANANIKIGINDRWGTAFLLHGSNASFKHDRNTDGFLDSPLSRQYLLLNRWEFHGPNGEHFQFGVKGIHIDKVGGQVVYDPETDAGLTDHWGMDLLTQRLEGWAKIGKINPKKTWQSTGLQLSAVTHHQDSWFGVNRYKAGQTSLYANLLFQSIIGNTNHTFKTGASVQYDDYKESLNGEDYDRTEIVPGGFFEYTYNPFDKFIFVAGIRADYHNLFGPFLTPRMFIRFPITERTILRVAGGRGQRTANVLAENNAILATSREVIIQGDDSDKPYGLNPEVAWNYGVNLTQNFTLDYRNGVVTFDFYRTHFENQIVIDHDFSPQQVLFYNLDGKSWSNSFQAQLDYEVINRLDLRIAYRWYDVKTTYRGQLLEKPLVSQHRGFLNVAYETRKYWKFDLTLNRQGKKRIPDLSSNPEEYRLAEYSPAYFLINTQVSKVWKEKLEVYLGVENLFGFKQKDPILSSEDPFSPYFDSSLIWGPVFGRNIYAGFRYKMK